jgi:transposase
MNHIYGFDRSQIFLLPEAVDDYVGADNPVRFIDAFVDELDSRQRGLSASSRARRAAPAMRRPIC